MHPNGPERSGMAALIAEIEAEVRATRDYLGKDRLDPAVIAALRAVPREMFVPEPLRGLAHVNRPLAIGHGQTISQPYIVAVMTDMLALDKASRVLDVGTGSGYQAAVLAALADEVYSVEVVPELSRDAGERLRAAGYDNVHLRVGDGRQGWPEHAPYDAIVVAAAAPAVPQPLLDQLAPGGRMAIPVGRPQEPQFLALIHKDAAGGVTERCRLPVAFVPLVENR